MSALVTVVLMILAGITTTKRAEGQDTPPSCASKFVTCANYLNSTRPPPSCCLPLISLTVIKEGDCLCKLYENPALLAAFHINVTQALKLPGYCGIPFDVSDCKALAPGSSSEPPPAVPGGNDGNGVVKIAGSGLSSLLLLLAFLMLF